MISIVAIWVTLNIIINANGQIDASPCDRRLRAIQNYDDKHTDTTMTDAITTLRQRMRLMLVDRRMEYMLMKTLIETLRGDGDGGDFNWPQCLIVLFKFVPLVSG